MPNSVIEWIAETAVKAAPEHGPDVGAAIVRKAIADKKYDPYRHLNLQALAEALLGRHTYESRLKAFGSRFGWVAEATEAVDLSAFRSIIGTNVGAVMERAYEDEGTEVNNLLGADPDDAGTDPMQTVKRPVSAVANDPPRDVAPATDYPRTGFAPFYVEAPRADKVGLIGVLTMELVKANAARRFLDAQAEVARKVAIEEKKRKLRVVLGITNNYKRNGTSYNTFLTSGDRVNRVTNLDLTLGPAELDRVAQLFGAMTDPFTGEPMDVEPKQILTTRANLFQLRNLMGVVELRTTNSTVQTVAAPPAPFDFAGELVTDRYVYDLLVNERGLTTTQAGHYVQIGDFPRAYKWREVEPFHTHAVGPGDEDWPPSFFQDIVYACKARFWGVGYVADPFAVAEAYG